VTQTYFGDEGVVLMTVDEVREVTLGEVKRKQVKRGEGGVAGDVERRHPSCDVEYLEGE
jgi:hypothetical protein